MAANNEFEYLLARSRTRETSTLTIATLAASASLILLGFYYQAQLEKESMLSEELSATVKKFGIIFPIVGIIYRDITAWTIQLVDEKRLRELSGISLRWYHYLIAGARELFLHGLLLIPVGAWYYL